MREIELEKSGPACLYRDNDEWIDPDKDFCHLDKRIQDALGHYQKDFMGEVSADNLGARWGGYGSFLPVERYGPLPTPTRPPSHISKRSPHNPTSEVRQKPTIQANDSVPIRPRPGIPSGQATSYYNAVDVRSSEDAFPKNQHKIGSSDVSDSNGLKHGFDNAIDNSAIYSGLGLDMSPSSSSGDSPIRSDGTPPRRRGLPENSPSYIIKVMTALPIPGGTLLSPISESLASLPLKEINLERSPTVLGASMKREDESISSEGKTVLLNERKSKLINRNKVPELQSKNCEDPSSIIGRPLKRMESKLSKGKELVNESPTSTNYMHLNKGTSTITEMNSISRPLNEISGVAKFMDAGTMFQKQSHAKQEPSLQKVDSLASPMASFEEKGNLAGFGEKIQTNMSFSSVIKSDADNDKLSQAGYVEQNSKTSKELKKKVKGEFQDSFSSQDVGIRHEVLTSGDIDKSRKQQRKMKNRVKVLPDSTFQKVGAYHEKTTDSDRSMEKTRSDKKPSSVLESDFAGKKPKNEEMDIFQGMKYPDGATEESLDESSNTKNLPQSQMRANLNNRKERPSSEGRKKIRKSQEGSQSSAVLPKVSFKVGSSSAFSQQPDCGSDFAFQSETKREPRNLKDRSSDVAGNAAHKKKEKISAMKDPIVGVAKREKYALGGGKLKDKSDINQYPSNDGLNPRADLTNNPSLMEKVPTSGAVPVGIAPVVIQEDWVQCDKCHTWRLLPHNIKPDDLPKRWLCSMLTWLPGMNSCCFTEEQTQDALRALYQTYQLPPAVTDAQTHQTYPIVGSHSVVASDKQPVGMTIPVSGLDAVPDTGKRGPKQEAYVKSKMDQLRTSESGNKQKLNLSRTGADKQAVIGKKREGSKDSHDTLKKVKRDAGQFAKDLNHAVRLATEIGDASLSYEPFSSQPSKDLVIEKSNISFKNLKEKTQPTVSREDERKDVSGKKRKLKDWIDGPLGTQMPSPEVPFIERSGEPRKEKRQKLKESNLQGKDKNGGGNQNKLGRKEDRPLEEHRRNMSEKTVDIQKSFKSDPELKLPALAAATSSSSKVSSSCRVKLKSRAKCSPVGSISSSPMKVSRSDHDRSNTQISAPSAKQDMSMMKKNHEVRAVAPDVTQQFEERAEGKSKKGRDAVVEFQPVQDDTVVKKKAYESKKVGTKLKEEGDSSTRKSVPTVQGARSFNATGLDKPKSDNMVPERVKREANRVGSSRDNPSSSTQVMDHEKVVMCDPVAAHDSKGEIVKQPGFGKLVADDVGASTSLRKDNPDRAARTALIEAKHLKHSANRMKINGSGINSTHVYIQAALKYLQGASLSEGSGCSDMKPSEVYSSTAKLCLYCAHEFEKKNDMASAALAYKCMEVAYMRVVYADDVAASRDRHELQLAQTEVPQVESPSSSASDVDNVNNPTPNDAAVKATQSAAVHRNYVISVGNRPSFVRLLNFAEVVNLAMDAARKAQHAFAIARSTLNEEGILAIKRVLDFSFHDVDELVTLVRLAIETLPTHD